MSYDDTFLRLPFHIYHGINPYQFLLLLESVYPHLYRVWYLLVVVKKDFFAYNLTYKKPRRLVGKLVFVKIWRTFRQKIVDAFQKHVYAKLVLGRYGKYLSLWQQPVPFLYNITKSFLVALVYLVYQQQHWHIHASHLLKEIDVFFRILYNVSDIEENVCICQCRLGESQHRLLKFIVWLQYTGSIREHYLHVVPVNYTHNPMSSGLSLECGDADTLAHQLVHQCRFSHVGITHDIYKSCLMHVTNKISCAKLHIILWNTKLFKYN